MILLEFLCLIPTLNSPGLGLKNGEAQLANSWANVITSLFLSLGFSLHVDRLPWHFAGSHFWRWRHQGQW